VKPGRRAALYLRVSTADKQTPENQEAPLRAYCAAEGLSIVAVYIDRASGAKGPRPEYERMKAAAYRRGFDVLVFWAMDRFSRAGTIRTVAELESLTAAGITWRSIQEPHLSTTEPTGQLLLMILTWMAQQERVRMVDRVNAGLDRARAEGKTLGRPRVELTQPQKEYIRTGRTALSIRWMAKALGIPQTAVYREIQNQKVNPPHAKTTASTGPTDRTRKRKADDAVSRDVRAAARTPEPTKRKSPRPDRDRHSRD